ncbi:DUF4190 domain-containing protein [Streptomyces sp. NPDC007088]|uniref:DUF4190 domain-containing protein n=1 Tax=Streptomyces sp. NPDC007088 TaxID=3364773 RepID=UPI0036AD45CE
MSSYQDSTHKSHPAPQGYSAQPGTRTGTNGLAVAGLVCGIVGILVFNIVLGPLAIIFGAVSRRAVPAKGGKGLSTAAIVLGVLDLLLFGAMLAFAASNGGFHWYVGG